MFVHLRWIRRLATVHVLAVVTVCGCRGVAPDGRASAAGQQRPDRPEGIDWSRLDSHDPRPDHPVYDELEPGVREALLRLNTCNKLDAHLHENPHLYHQESGAPWPTGEGVAWIKRRKEELRRLGVEPEWNSVIMLYQVK